MSKIQELQDMVSEMFKEASSKEDVDKLASINNKINEVVKEQDDLVKERDALILDYKKVITGSLNNESPAQVGNETPKEPPVLEDFLNAELNKGGK